MLKIEGQVAAILNERELVFNRGTVHGVQPGMIFAVMEKTIQVDDPETGKPLTSISRERVRVKVTQTYENHSFARTFETFEVVSGGKIDPVIATIFDPATYTPRRVATRVRTMRQSDNVRVDAPLDENESIVSKGDRIVLIDGPDASTPADVFTKIEDIFASAIGGANLLDILNNRQRVTELNANLATNAIGKRAKLTMKVDWAAPTPSGRYRGIFRLGGVHKFPDINDLEAHIWYYFTDRDPAVVNTLRKTQAGFHISAIGDIVRADFEGNGRPKFMLDMFQSRLLGVISNAESCPTSS